MAWLEWHTRRRAFGFDCIASPNGDELIGSSFAAMCATRLQAARLPLIAHFTSSSL